MATAFEPSSRPMVLLVDDNVEQRDLYALSLEHQATVVTASRGDEALALASRVRPHAAIVDFHMPGMDGLEVCRRLRAISEMRVVLLTADDDPDLPRLAQDVGAATVLTKPCTPERLWLAIGDTRQTFPASLEPEPSAPRRLGELEARIQHLQRMATVGQLVGGVAHDVNNLLTAILGYAGAAIEQISTDSPIHSDLREICRLAESAGTLTRPLLSFGRTAESVRVVDPHGSRTVLIVEHDEGVRRLAATVLRRQGFRIIEAASANEALTLSDGEPIDLMITGAYVPGARGRALAEQLRSTHHDLKVVYISDPDAVSASAALDRASTRWLEKPFTPAALLTVARDLLGGHDGHEA